MQRTLTLLGLATVLVQLASPTSIPANKTTVFNPSAFSHIKNQVDCNFDASTTCNWYISTDVPLLFELNRLTTPSDQTGPDFDHTKGAVGDGYYIYMEASAPSKLNEKAMLVSPDLYPANNDPVCFSFWYSMNGAAVGTLEVRQIHTTNVTLFSKTGDQGTQWKRGQVTVTPPGPISLVIEATVGDGYLGDIAVDDLSLTDGRCRP